MVEMKERWIHREAKILQAIVEAEESGEDPNKAASSSTDLTGDEYMRSIQRLYDDGYIDARFNRGDDRILSCYIIRAYPKALREVGLWPRAPTPLEEKQRRRLEFMTRLYARTDGNPMQFINARVIGAELGWQEEETFRVATYLRDEGLLSFRAVGGIIAITHAGVVEMEQAIANPQAATSHFPPINVINVFGNVNQSQLQAGTVDSHQEIEG